jgi:hypothetical protein
MPTVGNLCDALGNRLEALANQWGKEYSCSGGVLIEPNRELWMVKKDKGWTFLTIRTDTGEETKLSSVSVVDRLLCIDHLSVLKLELQNENKSVKQDLLNAINVVGELLGPDNEV